MLNPIGIIPEYVNSDLQAGEVLNVTPLLDQIPNTDFRVGLINLRFVTFNPNTTCYVEVYGGNNSLQKTTNIFCVGSTGQNLKLKIPRSVDFGQAKVAIYCHTGRVTVTGNINFVFKSQVGKPTENRQFSEASNQ